MADFALYIHINKINNKKYIGITCQKPVSNRWKNGLGYKECNLFYNSIHKYGWNNFEHLILIENLTKEEAEEKEKEYISKYKTTNRKYGYNVQKGGNINIINDFQRKNLSEAHKGIKFSEKTKRKMSVSHIGKNKCLGYKHTEETKEKHRQLMLGINNPKSKPVNQYDLDGNFIRRYNYMNEIKKYLNIKSTCHISDCCRGLRNKSHGYKWQYAE